MSYYDDPDWYDEEDRRRLGIREALIANSPHLDDDERMGIENESMRQFADANKNSAMSGLHKPMSPGVLRVFGGGVVDEEEDY